ncbi:hypothetical protein [Escherichia coli]|nr:hypothetical protein [Escherichia coli]
MRNAVSKAGIISRRRLLLFNLQAKNAASS